MIPALTIVGITVACLLLWSAVKFIETHTLITLLWRFALGHALDGKARTNAGYLRRGTTVHHHTGHASKWAHLPHLHRAGIRWLVVLVMVALTYGLLTARTMTLVSLPVTAVALAALNERRMLARVKSRMVTRNTVRPLSQAVASQFGTTAEHAAKSISIRPDYAASKSLEDIGTIVLPDHYAANDGQRSELESLVRSRLGIDLAFTWQTSRHPMILKISRAPIPPKMVQLATMLPVIKTLATDKVLLGVTGRAENKLWDMGSEDPHALVSANTRRGKTRLLLLIAAQVLAQGAERVTIIDPKRVGVDECLAGVSGVRVFNDPRNVQGMWDAVTDFRDLMDNRIEEYTADRTTEFTRALLIIDELSQFAAMSKVYWDSIREKSDRANPPVWNDLAAILWQGAQFKCSVLVFGQRIEHGTLGGLLDSFGTRLLAGFTKRTYERLIGVTPILASSKQRGRFVFYDGERPEYIQTVLGDDQELRDLAMTGREVTSPIVTSEVLT